MNNDRRFKPAVLAIVVLLAAAAVVTSGSAATPPSPGLAGGMVERNSARAAAPDLAAPVPGGPGFLMVSAGQFRPYFPDCAWAYDNGELYNPGPRDCIFGNRSLLPNR
jgi:hypothetical protein